MSIRARRTMLALLWLGPVLHLNLAAAQAVVGLAPADQLLAGGHYLRAEQPVRDALRRTPNDAHELVDLSVVDWAFNRLDSAIANAERAVAAAPNSAEAHSHLTDALGAKLATSNAGTFEKIALAHRFRKEIDRTLELDPNDANALEDLAEFYWHAPGMLGGDKSKARQTADRVFQISPFHGASARAEFAMEESDLRRRNAAIQAIWRAAVAVRQDDFDCRAALAAAYLEDAGDPSHLAAAEAEAKRAHALDPSRINSYSVLAVVYARTGRWGDLDAVLRQARAAVPDDRAPEYLAAVAILESGREANANPQLQRAEDLLHDYLAQPPEGQEPSHASAHWRLGQVLERQGRRADAVRELQMAVREDGSLDGAKRDLKRLS